MPSQTSGRALRFRLSNDNPVICFRGAGTCPRLSYFLDGFAQERRVLVFERWQDAGRSTVPSLVLASAPGNIVTATPHLPSGLRPSARRDALTALLQQLVKTEGLSNPICWFRDPVAFSFAAGLDAAATVYDCADDVCAAPDATPDLPAIERALIRKANMVLTGQERMFDAKRKFHRNTHFFKSDEASLSTENLASCFTAVRSLVQDSLGKRTRLTLTPQQLAGGPAIKTANRSTVFDYLIVGGGFAGSVLAERLARDGNKKVMLIDKRPHIGGNAYDHIDAAGVLVHKYGPHIFHTNSERIFQYLSRFTRWRDYQHRVLASTDGKLVPIPINRTTINQVYGLTLQTDEDAALFLKSRAEPRTKIETSEDVVVSAVGRELYERFFRGYTRKQWGLDPSQLDKSVTARVPTRTNTDDRYFTDSFQAMPLNGFTAMFENMLDHRNIRIETGVELADIRNEVVYDHLIYSGPIDEYFDHRFGPLPYRCLRFRHETVDKAQFQPVAVVNYPGQDVPHTRITEFKHLTGQVHAKTSIAYEYASDEGDPYYPVPRAENQALYKKYEALASQSSNVTFVGRLATYRYYNMDQIVGQALTTYQRLVETGKGKFERASLGRAGNGI